MRRREFITLVGGPVVGWPLAAHAQQTEQMRHIGVLMGLDPDAAGAQTEAAALKRGLQQQLSIVPSTDGESGIVSHSAERRETTSKGKAPFTQRP